MSAPRAIGLYGPFHVFRFRFFATSSAHDFDDALTVLTLSLLLSLTFFSHSTVSSSSYSSPALAFFVSSWGMRRPSFSSSSQHSRRSRLMKSNGYGLPVSPHLGTAIRCVVVCIPRTFLHLVCLKADKSSDSASRPTFIFKNLLH